MVPAFQEDHACVWFYKEPLTCREIFRFFVVEKVLQTIKMFFVALKEKGFFKEPKIRLVLNLRVNKGPILESKRSLYKDLVL